MKKVFIITKVSILLLAVALLISIIGGVSAAPNGEVDLKVNPNTGTATIPAVGETVVVYGVTSGYKLYIPQDFEFNDQLWTVHSKVVVSNITLSTNQVLNVSVSSKHGWVLKQYDVLTGGEVQEVPGGETIPYSMTFGSTILSSGGGSHTGLITSIRSGIPEELVEVTFEIDDSALITVASEYRDRLTFTAKVETVNP